MNDLSRRFERRLIEKGFIRPGEKILLACSGGADSTALFHLVESLRRPWRLAAGVLHFNHGLRGREASCDERFVRALAKQYGWTAAAGRGNVRLLARREKLSLEEAARKARYDFFAASARRRGVKKILLAHTRDDQAETVLLRVLQGTGLRGLAGIRERLVRDGAEYVRPLLGFSREDIRAYLKDRGLRWREDRTNRLASFPRNRIRLRLLPRLRREFNPRVTEALARIPASVAREIEVLEDAERTAWKKISPRRTGRGQVSLNRPFFSRLPAGLQFRLLGRALKAIHPAAGMTFDQWERLASEMGRGSWRQSLPRGIDLSLTPSKIKIYLRKTRR